MNRIVIIGVIFLFVASSVIPISGFDIEQSTTPITSGNIITVDNEGDSDYTSIKEAVNNASPGDTIEVYSGTYYEHNITIEKDEITLKGIPFELGTGNDTGKPFLNGQGLPPGLLTIRADGVTITGFYIEHDGTAAAGTITLNNVNNCLISENDINHTLGPPIYCDNSTHIRIINNTLNHSGIRQGICFTDCAYFIITSNIITYMGLDGILLWDSHHNLVSNNRIKRCGGVGITIIGDCNVIYENHIEDNDLGLYIGDSIFTIVKQNNFINNSPNAFCDLGLGFYPAFSNRWINNYWDNWRGIGPKVIPGTIMIFIPRFNFDWHPAKEPYDIEV